MTNERFGLRIKSWAILINVRPPLCQKWFETHFITCRSYSNYSHFSLYILTFLDGFWTMKNIYYLGALAVREWFKMVFKQKKLKKKTVVFHYISGQPNTARCSPLQSKTDKYCQEQPSRAQFSPLGPSAARCPVNPVVLSANSSTLPPLSSMLSETA